MKAMVTNAETNGGGWVPLEIHDVCDGEGDPLLPAVRAAARRPATSRAPSTTQFLDWLQGEIDAGPRAGQDRA